MPTHLYPCHICGRTDPRRMIALMSLWFAAAAGVHKDGGYFYLCPVCYGRLIEPQSAEIMKALTDQHPFLHRGEPARHYEAEGPAGG